MVLSRGTALANTTSGNTSDGSFKYLTYRRYRLICVQHPAELVGQVAWLEASSLENLENPIPCVIKVEAEGPSRGQTFTRRRILARWTSNQTNLVMKSVIHRLVLLGQTYDGGWIRDGAPIPEQVAEKENIDSPELPISMPEFAFVVDRSEITASVTKAGFFLGGLVVSGGRNVSNNTIYQTSDGETSDSESGAIASLGVPDVSGGGSISPKSISLNQEIKNKSGFTISTSGKNVVHKQYSAKEDENGQKRFEFNGSLSSTLAASINMDWKIVLQTQTKKIKTLDGREIETTSISDWTPFLPAPGM